MLNTTRRIALAALAIFATYAALTMGEGARYEGVCRAGSFTGTWSAGEDVSAYSHRNHTNH